MSSLYAQYLDEVRTERAKILPLGDSVFTDADLLALPEPVKRYLQVCGYVGAPKQLYGRLIWEDVRMRFSPRGNWWSTDCFEFLAAPLPMRIAHLKTRIAGLIPFEAIDKYQAGHGNMLIRLANLFTLQDVKGIEMDQSALVTFLSESLLLPAIALQPYICWSAVSEHCAMATIRCNNTTVSGSFHFNHHYEFTRFETEDRWKALSGGRSEKTRWMVDVSDYEVDNGIFHPGRVSAAWIYADHRQEYFTGKTRGIL